MVRGLRFHFLFRVGPVPKSNRRSVWLGDARRPRFGAPVISTPAVTDISAFQLLLTLHRVAYGPSPGVPELVPLRAPSDPPFQKAATSSQQRQTDQTDAQRTNVSVHRPPPHLLASDPQLFELGDWSMRMKVGLLDDRVDRYLETGLSDDLSGRVERAGPTDSRC